MRRVVLMGVSRGCAPLRVAAKRCLSIGSVNDEALPRGQGWLIFRSYEPWALPAVLRDNNARGDGNRGGQGSAMVAPRTKRSIPDAGDRKSTCRGGQRSVARFGGFLL